MSGQSVTPGTRALVEKLSGRALEYEELARRAASIDGMGAVAEQYAAHAHRFRTAIEDLRAGRSLKAAGAAESAPPSGGIDTNTDAARRAAARRKRMLEAGS